MRGLRVPSGLENFRDCIVRNRFLAYPYDVSSTEEEKTMGRIISKICRKYAKLALVVPLALVVAACSSS